MSSLGASTVVGPQIQSPTAHIARHTITAAHDLDPAGLQAQLDLAAAAFGLARCIDEIVIPATRQLHLLVATGHRDHAQELIATETVRAWLNRRGWTVPAPEPIGTILLGCGPRDSDPVGPESLALLLRIHRRPCRVLGTRTSTFTLTVAARATDTMGVVVFSDDRRGRPQAVVSLRAVDALAIPVFYAGNAFHIHRSRQHVPGRYLGARIQQAAATIIRTLPPPGPRH
jgi:hypothetical protein